MNFKQMMAKQLSDKGMFDSDIEKLLETVMADKSFCPDMGGRWGSAINDYPSVICASVLSELWPAALKWIEKNDPDAWYLVQFTPEYIKLSGAERDKYVDDFMAFGKAGQAAFGAFDPKKPAKKSWGRPRNKKKQSR